jgi:hypothetical protein
MEPFVWYYFHHDGGGKDIGIGPVYAVPLFIQRTYGITGILGDLWRLANPSFESVLRL